MWEAKVECEFHWNFFGFRYARISEIDYIDDDSLILADLSLKARLAPPDRDSLNSKEDYYKRALANGVRNPKP